MIRPLSDRVVVKVIENTEQMRGALFIPEIAREKPQTGEIVAAGPGRITEHGSLIPTSVGIGEVVMFGKYSGTEITIDGEQYLIMRESDLLAVV